MKSDEGAYVPVGAPAVVSERCWRGVAYLPGGDGMVTEFVADGRMLGVAIYSMRERPTDPVEVGELPFVAEAAVEVEDGYLIIGEGQKAMVTPDDGGILRISDPDSELPEVVVETRSLTTISQSLPAVKLKDDYNTHSTTLSAADTSAVSSMLATAYREISADAAASGLFIQGVMSRVVMRDTAGNLIFRSTPVWHTCLSGSCRPQPIYMNIDTDSRQTANSSMPLEAYRLYLRLPPCPAGNERNSRVARLEVELTPQIHLPQMDMKATSRIVSAVGGPLQVEARLQGCSLPDESFRSKMKSAVESADYLFRVACSVPYPFKGREKEEFVPVFPLRMTVDEECAALGRYGNKAKVVESSTIPLSRFSPPHAVAPRVLHNSTGTPLLASPSVTLYPGHSLDYFTHERGVIDKVETVVAVELEGGKRRVVRHTLSASTKMPRSISPLFTYPDPSATRATFMAMGSDGLCSKLTVPLTPAAGFAYWISDTLRPVALSAAPDGDEFFIPRTVNTEVFYPGCLVSTLPGYPFAALSAMQMAGDICAIYPAPRPASSSWESGSPRFIVAGTGGIWSVGVNSAGHLTRPVLLDGRPVLDRRAIAPASVASGGARLYVLAGGDLLAVSSNKVTVVKRNVSADILVWSHLHGELCLIRPGEDSAEVYSPASESWSTRTLPSVIDTLPHQSAARLTSSTAGYLDLNAELDAPVRCTLSDALPLAPGRHPFRPSAPVTEVLADLTSSQTSADLDIQGSHGSLSTTPLSRLTFSGPVNAPIVHRLLIPHRYKLSYRLDGLFASDTRIYSIKAR
ncbi:MAG: hypothetical protein K2J07_05555 [Muribaculaceae bacterium]|nr:hypothetical protein [Muribaculaceae bacterium]